MKGSITVFLALSLSALTGFVLLLLGNAVRNAEKIRLEGAMNLGMNSVLGEFHTGLHDRYGLLLIDLSYDNGEPSLYKLEERLDYYIRQNTKKERYSPQGIAAPKKVHIRQVTSAAFGEGNAMKYQAVCYMQDCNRTEMAYGKNWKIITPVSRDNPLKEWDELMTIIADMELPKIQDENGRWKEVPLENPADAVFAMTGNNACYLAGIDTADIGVGIIQTDAYASHRTLENVTYGEYKKSDTELFVAYLFDKAGYYGKIRDNSYLQYQLEYIAMGKGSDYENMQQVADEILQWCFARNAEYIMRNDSLWNEALQRAGRLPAVALKEDFRVPVAESMLYALAYLESLAEIRCLFSDGSIAHIKDGISVQWEHVENAIILQVPSVSKGICYGDFLAAMLMCLSERERNLRSMDIMEMDIRMLSHNPYFAMDFCVQRIEAEVEAGSYFLRRTYGYY